MRTGLPLRTAPWLRLHSDFAVMWAVALLGAAALRGADDAEFERFIGGVSPIVAVGVAGLVGMASLSILDTRGWVGTDPRRRGLARSTLLAGGFGAAILIADSTLGFGESINISWPTSILFYPVMGFVAEVAFHLAPLALVDVVTRRTSWTLGAGKAIAPLVLVASIEAVYQLLGSATAETSPWLLAYLALHMSVFGFLGLTALRRHGFGAMMWLRLVYYLIWHVVWGALRLEVLF